MANPRSQGDRAKAYRLRKLDKAGKLGPVDKLWLAEFEEEKAKHEATRRVRTPSTDIGASRSAREVSFSLKEEAEAAGTGDAAKFAAAALAAKEEGRRLDFLTTESVAALKEACRVYRSICLSMRERMEALEHTQVELLVSVRTHYLARAEAETQLMQKATENPADELLMMLAAKVLGVPPGLPGRPAAPGGKGRPAQPGT